MFLFRKKKAAEKKQLVAEKKPEVVGKFTLPFLHPKVDLTDLHDNFKLLTDTQIKQLHKVLDEKPDGRYSKLELLLLGIKNPSYGIIKKGPHLYAIYKGIKFKKHLGKGTYGKVKLLQNLDTGIFIALKVITGTYKKKETEYLEKMGMLMFEMTHISAHTRKAQVLIGMVLAEGDELSNVMGIYQKNKPQSYLAPLQLLMLSKKVLYEIKSAHDKLIIHKDIKPGNIVVNPASISEKLVDFGLAGFAAGTKNLFFKFSDHPGTYVYLAPEIIDKWLDQDKLKFNEASEVYAAGLSLAEQFNLVKKLPSKEIKTLNKTYAFERLAVVDPDHELFKNNPLLPKDPENRERLRSLLAAMTGPAKQRPSIRDAYRKMNEILRAEFKEGIKVGVLLVDDFLNLKEDERETLIKKMMETGMNTILLTDTKNNRSEKEYYKLMAFIRKMGFNNIEPEVFHAPDQNRINTAAFDYFQGIYQATPIVFSISKEGVQEEEIDLTNTVVVVEQKRENQPKEIDEDDEVKISSEFDEEVNILKMEESTSSDDEGLISVTESSSGEEEKTSVEQSTVEIANEGGYPSHSGIAERGFFQSKSSSSDERKSNQDQPENNVREKEIKRNI